MLKRLSAFKKGIKAERRISDYQIKDSHYLFPDEKSDPVKDAFFNREIIEEKCEKLRFKISPASERECKLTRQYLNRLGHNIHRMESFNFPANLRGQNKLKLLFKEPKLTPYVRNAFINHDYTVRYSDITQQLEKNPLEVLSRGDIATYLPSEIRDEFSIIKYLVDLENTFDKTNYVAELNDDEVLIGNLPASFNFYAFKTQDYYSFFEKGKAQRFNVIKDMFNQPALLKVKFESAEAAKSFAQATHGSEYHNSVLQVFTNHETSAESEVYENRTVYFSGFNKDITQNEILSTVNRFAKVLDIHYPVSYDFNQRIYSKDVREFVDKNRNLLPPDIQIVIREFDGSKTTNIVVYQGNKLGDEDLKFMIDEVSLDDSDSYSFEKHAALRRKENIEFIKQIVREQMTININTLNDNLKVSFGEGSSSSDNNQKVPEIPKNLSELSTDEVKSVIENLISLGKRAHTKRIINPFMTDCPFQAKPVGNGWCLITFPTLHEARKAIYGMRFESQFDKLKIELHAGKQLFEYFETLNSKMYSTISKNQLKRSNLVDAENERIENEIIDENVSEYYEKRLGHNRTGDREDINLALGSKFGESDVNKVRETDSIQKAKTRQTLEDKMREYMNTFVVNEKFTRSENIESNLAGFEKIDDLMEMRGRKFNVMDRETGLHIFKKRLQKTGETYELEQNKEAVRFISGLKQVLGSDIEKNSAQVADILDNLALEYGYTTDEASSFKALLGKRKQTVPRLGKSNYSTILSEEAGDEVATKPQIDVKKVSARKQMFEHLNRLAKPFSTGHAPLIPDYLEIYQKYYKVLESKLNGDFFKTRQFKEYLIDNYLIKSEK